MKTYLVLLLLVLSLALAGCPKEETTTTDPGTTTASGDNKDAGEPIKPADQ